MSYAEPAAQTDDPIKTFWDMFDDIAHSRGRLEDKDVAQKAINLLGFIDENRFSVVSELVKQSARK